MKPAARIFPAGRPALNGVVANEFQLLFAALTALACLNKGGLFNRLARCEEARSAIKRRC